MKYVIVQNKTTGLQTPVIFDEEVVHKDIVRAIGKTHCVVSAGFCHKEDKTAHAGWRCHGKSESLLLSTRLEDAALINFFMCGYSGFDLQNLMILVELEMEKKST